MPPVISIAIFSGWKKGTGNRLKVTATGCGEIIIPGFISLRRVLKTIRCCNRKAWMLAFGHIAFDSTGYQDFKDLLADKGMKYEEHPTPDKDMMQIFFPDPNGVVVEMVFAMAEVEAAKATQSVAAAE